MAPRSKTQARSRREQREQLARRQTNRPPAPLEHRVQRTAARRSAFSRGWALRLPRWVIVGGATLALLTAIGVAHAVTSGGPASAPSSDTSGATASGVGQFRQVVSHPTLTEGRAPVLLVSAQYCVFCAAERWALVDALRRFGALDGARPSQSAPGDGIATPIPTYDLTQATYTSATVAFQHVDVADVHGNPLQQLSPTQQALLDRYDPQGSIPFLLIGGQYVQLSSGYSPGILQGRSFAQVQQALGDPHTPVAAAIHTEVTHITALICHALSGSPAGSPARVCGQPDVQSDLAHLR